MLHIQDHYHGHNEPCHHSAHGPSPHGPHTHSHSHHGPPPHWHGRHGPPLQVRPYIWEEEDPVDDGDFWAWDDKDGLAAPYEADQGTWMQ